MFSDYMLAEKLDKIADAIKEARKEGITVGDLYKLVQDKKRFLIYSNHRYRVIYEDDFDNVVRSIRTQDGFILIN